MMTTMMMPGVILMLIINYICILVICGNELLDRMLGKAK